MLDRSWCLESLFLSRPQFSTFWPHSLSANIIPSHGWKMSLPLLVACLLWGISQ